MKHYMGKLVHSVTYIILLWLYFRNNSKQQTIKCGVPLCDTVISCLVVIRIGIASQERKFKSVSIIFLMWKFLIFHVTCVTSKQTDVQHLTDTSRVITCERLLLMSGYISMAAHSHMLYYLGFSKVTELREWISLYIYWKGIYENDLGCSPADPTKVS